jgi:para-aminobenzoate synthetase
MTHFNFAHAQYQSQDEYSRYSYLASGVFSLSYSTSTNCVDIVKDGQFLQSQVLETSFWEWFEHIQADIQRDVQALGCSPIEKHEAEMKATLQVGFMGYFGYEMKRESLPGYHWSLQKAVPDTCVPDAQFLFAQQVLRYDHLKDTWKLFGLIRKGDADPIAFRIRSAHSVGLTDEQFRCNKTNFKEAFSKRDYAAVEAVSLPKFECPTDSKSYMRSIALAKAAIKEGESYEMTLTTKFHARLNEINPFELYKSLRAKNPAPYSALLNFPATDVSILSSSPERFISISQHGVAEMKPIKGTLAVSKDPEEDSRRKHRLATDVKELAENLMIVDLIRSDLHRVSPTTSIKVPKLMQVESYETVHQLVTTIQSYIRPDVGTVKAIKSVFPPGSMTGAPKLRSVQILERLERNKERGVYSGCLGYICVSGAADQSVVIRTIVRKGNDLELGAGGAITWLSDPEKEWEEVLVKAKAVADIATTQSRAEAWILL